VIEQLGTSPARLPVADLASVFGPPDRAAGLAGKLAPVPRPAAPLATAPAPVEASPEPTAATPGQADIQPEPSRAAPPRSSAVDGDRIQPVIVYLPASLRDQVRERAAETRSTYTELALEAIDATYPRLGDLITKGQPKPRDHSLFAGPARPRRQRHDEPQVQVSLRPARRDLEVIDRLVVDLRAPSRSALIATALTAHLTP
jgi:hypothetical protein